jgi:hypothetical protein
MVPAQGDLQGSIFTCQPTVDGLWAGHSSFPGVPPTDSTHEGWITLSPFYGVWHSSRVYSNISAGAHAFGIQCLSPNAHPLIGYPTGSIAGMISLTVIELR